MSSHGGSPPTENASTLQTGSPLALTTTRRSTGGFSGSTAATESTTATLLRQLWPAIQGSRPHSAGHRSPSSSCYRTGQSRQAKSSSTGIERTSLPESSSCWTLRRSRRTTEPRQNGGQPLLDPDVLSLGNCKGDGDTEDDGTARAGNERDHGVDPPIGPRPKAASGSFGQPAWPPGANRSRLSRWRAARVMTTGSRSAAMGRVLRSAHSPGRSPRRHSVFGE